jgi:threonylcarbamoyladenosine tRNA methylthiotransferase MtaB
MVHIFPYSKRKGTPAAEMKGQISGDVKKQRLHTLEAVAAESRKQILEETVKSSPIVTVLFETYEDGIATGHTADFIEVSVKSDIPLHAELKNVRLTHTDGTLCYGELL